MKKLVFLAAMLFFVSSMYGQKAVETQYPGDALAQEIYKDALERQVDDATRATKTSWVANRARDNWFLSFGGGVGTMLTGQTTDMDFSDYAFKSWVGQISVGKWASPALGFRLNLTASELNNFTHWPNNGMWYIGEADNAPKGAGKYIYAGSNGEYIKDNFLKDTYKSGDGDGYTYKTMYGAATFDVLWNLKNTFTAYNPKAFFNPVLYAGLGYAYTFEGDSKTDVHSMIGKAGLQLNFRLADSWDFFLDGHVIGTHDQFDRYMAADSDIDFIANVTAGFTYRINFRHFIKSDFNDPSIVDGLNRKINELRNENEMLRNRPAPVCPDCPKCPEVVVVEEKPAEYLPAPVFFKINSHTVAKDQFPAIAAAANFLKENPTAKLHLTGYADAKTGTSAINERLSKQRVQAVADILVKDYGIAKNRLITEAKGDTVQPFEQNDWNRVVVFVIGER